MEDSEVGESEVGEVGRIAVHGFTVASLLALHAGTHRQLDVVEVWCGVGSTLAASKHLGLATAGFDTAHGNTEDIRTKEGTPDLQKSPISC